MNGRVLPWDPAWNSRGQALTNEVWLTQTTAEVRYFRFAGNHFFLHSAEQLVLSRIAEELTKLSAHQPIGG